MQLNRAGGRLGLHLLFQKLVCINRTWPCLCLPSSTILWPFQNERMSMVCANCTKSGVYVAPGGFIWRKMSPFAFIYVQQNLDLSIHPEPVNTESSTNCRSVPRYTKPFSCGSVLTGPRFGFGQRCIEFVGSLARTLQSNWKCNKDAALTLR